MNRDLICIICPRGCALHAEQQGNELNSYVVSDMMWDDPGMGDPGYMDPGYMDPSIPADGNEVEEPILPLWLFLCIQGAILVIVIPVTRAIRLAVYRNKIKREDAI